MINARKIFFNLLIILIIFFAVAISLGAIFYLSRADYTWLNWPFISVGYGYYKDGNDIVIEPYTYKQYLQLYDAPLGAKIDVKSFRVLSKEWAKDKNYSYYIFSMGEDCCYAYVFPLSVDVDSVRLLDSSYAADKNHVYKNDKIVEGADQNTFVPPPPSSK